MDSITANYSHYIVPEYEIGDCVRLERILSRYDKRRFRLNPIGFVYDAEKKELRIPRGLSETLLESVTRRKIVYNDQPNAFDKTNIKLTHPPREKLQVRVISFLCGGSSKYAYTKNHTQLFCDLETGKGKTYCATASITHFKQKAVVFTPSRISKINDQWIDTILSTTDRKEKHILEVVGSKTCLEIIDGKHQDVEFFIFGRATASSFAKKHGWDMFQKMIEMTRAGIKIIDEAHMDFETNVKIDCYSNVKRNFYLTATAGRGSIEEDIVFKKLFEGVPILGMELTTIENNYIMMFIFLYSHTPTIDQRLSCKTKDGLSAALYSEYLANKEGARYAFFTAMDKAIKTIVMKYRTDGGKLLILGSTRELLKTIKKFLEVNYSEFSIGMYTGDVDRKEREQELDRDIILATDKGIGTGADINNLQFLINVIPYSNKIYASQLSGRLRNNGKLVFYMELVNKDFHEAMEQFERRKPHLAKKAKQGKLFIIDE